MRIRSLITVVTAAILLSGCSHFFAPRYSERGQKMDIRMWEQHCVGRYMVNLPLGSKTTLYTTYNPGGLNSTKFEYMEGMKKEDIHRLVSARIATLQKELNKKTGASMFLGTVVFPNGGEGIVQWESKFSNSLRRFECYFVTHGDRQYVFKFSHIAMSNSDTDFDPSFCRLVAENLYSREPDEVPEGKGFVVDHGFIAKEDHSFLGQYTLLENSRLVFSVPDFPEVYFELFVNNIERDPRNLLDQVDPDYIMMTYSDKKVIRRGKHRAGEIPGEEICVSGEREGATAFECQWGSPGKFLDLANQELNLIVQVRANERKGTYPTQEELLRLWDAIIGTIRLRPGAV